MKQLFWKLRFAASFVWLTRMSPRFAWNTAGAWLEDVLGGDTTIPPAECVEEEIEEGLRS